MSNDCQVMLDIETLDTSSRAIVLSIGACRFFPHHDDIEEVLYKRLDMDAQPNRTISMSTFHWWLKQKEASKYLVDPEPGKGSMLPVMHPINAIRKLADFVDSAPVWGFGAAFDNAVIADLAREFGVTIWPYKQDRCFRTFVSLFDPYHKVRPEQTGVAHHAADDAVNQAMYFQNIVQNVGIARCIQ